MKFSIDQQDFNKALTTASRSVLTKANLPILSNLMLSVNKNLEVVSTNLETAIKINVPCKVEVPGSVTVSARALLEFVSQLGPGEIVCEKLGEELVLSAKGSAGRFATMNSEEFPAIPK